MNNEEYGIDELSAMLDDSDDEALMEKASLVAAKSQQREELNSEQCGFDEVSAMMNCSDDEELTKGASVMAATTQQQEESSDDDIDDDELDRLAMLVERGDVDDATHPKETVPLQCTPSPPLIKQEPVELITHTETAMEKELREMKEKIRLLEFQLKNAPAEKNALVVKTESKACAQASTRVGTPSERRQDAKPTVGTLTDRREDTTKTGQNKVPALLAGNPYRNGDSSQSGSATTKSTPIKPGNKHGAGSSGETRTPTRDSGKTGSSVKNPDSGKPAIKNSDSSKTLSKNSDSGKTPSRNSDSGKTPSRNSDSGKTPSKNSDSAKTPSKNSDSGNAGASRRNGGHGKEQTPSKNCNKSKTSHKNGGHGDNSPSRIKESGKIRTPSKSETLCKSGESGDKRTPSRSVDSGNRKSGQKQTTTSAVRLMKDLEVDLFGTDSESANVSKPFDSQSESKPPGAIAAKSSQKPGFDRETSGEASVGLYQEDDENEWDMDGDGGSSLSEQGKEYSALLNVRTNRGERVAHESTLTMDSITNRKATWGTKALPKRFESGMPTPKAMKSEEYDTNVSVDPFSGIRLMNPLVSSTQMKSRMENRNIVKLSTIHTKPKSSLEGDWVTIGVITYKSDPKTSQKGNAFSIWNLSDLRDCSRIVKLFLFGETHKAHWKTSVGGVVGVLNPSIMQNNDKYQNKSDEVCITVDHPKKLMLMGTSKDLGYCKSKTKAGRNCTQFLNKKQDEYCAFHVQKKYKETSGKRAELQAGHSGVVPKSFEKRLFPKSNSQVSYAGKSYSTVQTTKEKKVSLKSLVQHGAHSAPGKFTTLALHPLLPEDTEKLLTAEKAKEAVKHKEFHVMLSTPTVGAVNFVKHLAVKQLTPGGQSRDVCDTVKVAPQLGAKDLLRQHQRDLDQRRLDYRRKQQEQAAQAHRRGSSGPMIDLDEPLEVSQSPSVNSLQFVPKLGRGLPAASKPLYPKNQNALLDKKKAAFLMQARGGITKEDPNAVRKAVTSETRDNIKKRLVENIEEKDDSSASVDEPPRKKSRLLGDVDLDDPEVQKLLKSKSKHAHKLTEAEEEKQEQYFSVREKKEAMEEQMAKIHKIESTAVTCKQCKYTAFSALDTCKQQGHTILRHKALKRFFNCKECKSRTTCLTKLPTLPCNRCGSRNWEKSSMMKEKKAALPGEELLLRGEERKYVNS